MKNITRFEATRLLQALIGQDLRTLAAQHGITVFKEKLNKGWAGLTLEKVLGIGNRTMQAADADTWELKLVPMVTRKGAWKVKESMAITMLNPHHVLEKSFEQSHLFNKMSKLIICGRERVDNRESTSKLLYVNSFDLQSTKLWKQVQADYELVQHTIRNKGYDALTGKMGTCIQPRTKGTGHGSTTRAFYARRSFLETILGIRES